MTDDDPFADLGATLEDESDSQNETTVSERETKGTKTDSSENSQSDQQTSQKSDPKTEAAFSYEAAKQRPFYAREESITDFDAWLNYELERELSSRGYRNIVVREMTDALLRTVVEEDLVAEVAERFENAREDSISE